MIKQWLITGDTHGNFNHFNKLAYMNLIPEETGIIILGDVGLNFSLDRQDDARKELLNSFGYQIYCIRGNHEFRPEQIFFNENKHWDTEVKTQVYWEDKYPNIKYFCSGGTTCTINKKRILIIDGAYSVDTPYRRLQGWPWNPQEQLGKQEREALFFKVSDLDLEWDLILSHTCPITWQPTDLFSSGIDQSTVDQTMEYFLEEIAEIASWKTWCWGHFHETREYSELEDKPGRKRLMIFQDFIPLEEIVD